MGAFLAVLVLIFFIILLAKSSSEKKRVERRRIDRVNQRYSDPTLRQLITERKIWQGMTREQLIELLGKTAWPDEPRAENQGETDIRLRITTRRFQGLR